MRLPGAFFARNLVERRALLIQLVRRDFRQRFVGSAAGWLWGVIHPLVLLASWTFVFEVCLDYRLPAGSLTSNYPIFLFAGFLPWLLFQETTTRSASCLVEQSNLITKTVFPSEILPVTIFLSSLIHHAIAVGLVLAATLFVLGSASPGVVWLPLYMFLTGLFAVGVAWIVASLQVYLRDTAQIFTVVMTLWFWITPVFINAEQIPERFRWVVKLNPMAHLVNAYRARLLSTAWPDWRELAAIAAGAVAMFLIGGLFFRHLKRGFADVL